MTVPVRLVLSEVSRELPHQFVVTPFHLPAGRRVLWTGIVTEFTQNPEDALVSN